MKNSKLRRVLLLLACAVMLVSLSVGATLAYLTGKDEVVNTFTVGNVQIKLDEAKVNTDGTYVTDHDNRINHRPPDDHLIIRIALSGIVCHHESAQMCLIVIRIVVRIV